MLRLARPGGEGTAEDLPETEIPREQGHRLGFDSGHSTLTETLHAGRGRLCAQVGIGERTVIMELDETIGKSLTLGN